MSSSRSCPNGGRDVRPVNRGEALPIDEHFDRRLETLLDKAERSGDYVGATKDDFDAMEREAFELVRKRKSS